jgi:hypothetical protein
MVKEHSLTLVEESMLGNGRKVNNGTERNMTKMEISMEVTKMECG